LKPEALGDEAELFRIQHKGIRSKESNEGGKKEEEE
jgi:hypothetical protein